ncbi:MAG: nitroreductase family deazaflavin-dependent oxidoreductase [Actinomycetota bacterium]
MAWTYRLGTARRAFNAVASKAIGLGLAPPASYILETRGRRSGELRSTPVSIVRHDGARWLVAPYGIVGWVHNARAAGRVTLRRGRNSEEHGIREASPSEAAPVLRKYLRLYPVVAPFFDAGFRDPLETFEDQASKHPVFRVDG